MWMQCALALVRSVTQDKCQSDGVRGRWGGGAAFDGGESRGAGNLTVTFVALLIHTAFHHGTTPKQLYPRNSSIMPGDGPLQTTKAGLSSYTVAESLRHLTDFSHWTPRCLGKPLDLQWWRVERRQGHRGILHKPPTTARRW